MMRYFALAAWSLAASAVSTVDAQEVILDSNTAFYEGQRYRYVIAPPTGFRMVTEEAQADGFSFAFIPGAETYAEAGVWIRANLFRLNQQAAAEGSFEMILTEDTSALREVYGPGLIISQVDSLADAERRPFKTFYLNDESRFMPDVMVSYFDGGTEVLLLNLSIQEGHPRFEAEISYDQCLSRFKALEKAELDSSGKQGLSQAPPAPTWASPLTIPDEQ